MANTEKRKTVLMLDLFAVVPYYVAYLSRALIAAGLSVRTASITYYLDLECFRSRGVRLQPGCMDAVGKRPTLPPAIRRAAKLLEGMLNLAALSLQYLVTPPGIIHVQYLSLLRWPVPLDLHFVRWMQRRGVRIVLTVHDVLPHDTGVRFRATFASLYHSVDQLICHSAPVRDRLVTEFSLDAAKIHVIPHGPFFYDLPASAGPTEPAYPTPYVLWQGLIFPYKGVDLLLGAWRQVEAEHAVGTLVIAGAGAPELVDELRRLVEAYKLQRVVLDSRFTSAQELVATYRAAAVVVYPYRAITTSGSLATGMALGKAIVATDLPTFRDALTDGTDALLVPVGDTAALAGALLRLLQDQDLRRRLATNMAARNFGDETWRSIALATQDVYDVALRTPSRREVRQ